MRLLLSNDDGIGSPFLPAFAAALSEVADFAECGLCGTAAVISPVGMISDHGKDIYIPAGMEKMGPVTEKLYNTIRGIQMGTVEAPEGWLREVCKK